ncbi:hypothetical protein [Arcobacter sp. s6]|jgi:hypothetical protein|uniref:hypothetical protein n=1 Tax=Arcobacter sp. s6 TaxID=3230363 RepID=UPI0034A023B6
MKNSFSLLEVILTLVISSIVIIYSSFLTKELILDNKYNQNIEIAKINILSTKIFFEKHKNELDLINYSNENLYFKGSLLLEKVKEFSLNNAGTIIKININYDDKIKQLWEFKK